MSRFQGYHDLYLKSKNYIVKRDYFGDVGNFGHFMTKSFRQRVRLLYSSTGAANNGGLGNSTNNAMVTSGISRYPCGDVHNIGTNENVERFQLE